MRRGLPILSRRVALVSRYVAANHRGCVHAGWL